MALQVQARGPAPLNQFIGDIGKGLMFAAALTATVTLVALAVFATSLYAPPAFVAAASLFFSSISTTVLDASVVSATFVAANKGAATVVALVAAGLVFIFGSAMAAYAQKRPLVEGGPTVYVSEEAFELAYPLTNERALEQLRGNPAGRALIVNNAALETREDADTAARLAAEAQAAADPAAADQVAEAGGAGVGVGVGVGLGAADPAAF